MAQDFDVRNFIEHLRATKPPYECPFDECRKIYKSYNGIQSHLASHGVSSELLSGDVTDSFVSGQQQQASAKIKGLADRNSNKKTAGTTGTVDADSGGSPSSRENLTYAQAQKFVEFDLSGKSTRLSILQPLEIITCDELISETTKKSPGASGKHKEIRPPGSPKGKPPEPQYRVMENYNFSGKFEMPENYIRFVEKQPEELDAEVEYDMDEEDHAWLDLMNSRRKPSAEKVSEDIFELAMDRLEKESYFQNQDAGPFIDETAVCCVCNDGECENSNVILFCDMCNLAVHQDCYGVPYIPEGEWLCRRCQLSPSKAVDCCLCPNKGGAFKQTVDGRWAHVACALWVPEVQFANVVFLEPIEGFERIPAARWKLSCYVCKQRGVGACIQCHKPNCYTAFHVTCAQSAGLYMHLEAINDGSPGGQLSGVRKTAFCDVHAPVNNGDGATDESFGNGLKDSASKKSADPRELSKKKIRMARKMLLEQRTVVPKVSIPVIPKERLDAIARDVKLSGKIEFFQHLVGYWSLKRKARFGVPLLRRLQVYHQAKKALQQIIPPESSNELKAEIKQGRKLRADLERVRLLCELIRKRERRKMELIDNAYRMVDLLLRPLTLLYVDILDKIQAKDKFRVFAEPVSEEKVPGYRNVIEKPMDLGTIKNKALHMKYSSLDEIEADFNLMIQNCLRFNPKGSYYHKLALKIRRTGHFYFQEARKKLCLYNLTTGMHINSVDEKINFAETDIVGVKMDFDDCPLVDQMEIGSEAVPSTSTATPEATKLNRKAKQTKEIKKTKDLSNKDEPSRSVRSKQRPETGFQQSDPVTALHIIEQGISTCIITPVSGSGNDVPPASLDKESFKHFRTLKSDNEAQSADSETATEDDAQHDNDTSDSEILDDTGSIKLSSLDLVWVNFKGALWCPGLLIDPNMPRSGLYQKSVAIPVPPATILSAQRDAKEKFLVVLFDTKRTWLWTSRPKLEHLAVDLGLDKEKLRCTRKPSDKKMIREAYKMAIAHRCSVIGDDSTPELMLSTDEDSTDDS